MLLRFCILAMGKFPFIRRMLIKKMYDSFAGRIQAEDWRFMNFGYAYTEEKGSSVQLEAQDQQDQYCFQLYEQLLRQVTINPSSRVLEVGSGRGGGAFLTHKYFKPDTTIGLDISDEAVKLCNRIYATPGLNYVQGDACALPFPDNSFDVVINIESSHGYPCFKTFLSEVKRVLKPGGYLLLADFRASEDWQRWQEELKNGGLEKIDARDILPNVRRAMEFEQDRKEQLIQSHVPPRYQHFVRNFAGMRNSLVYNRFHNGEKVYWNFVMQKPA